MNGQNIRIRLKAFDHRILDASTREIVSTALSSAGWLMSFSTTL